LSDLHVRDGTNDASNVLDYKTSIFVLASDADIDPLA